jgi:hypothetical protein
LKNKHNIPLLLSYNLKLTIVSLIITQNKEEVHKFSTLSIEFLYELTTNKLECTIEKAKNIHI